MDDVFAPSGPACPRPDEKNAVVQLVHGGGGRRMHQLIETCFQPFLASPQLGQQHDGAILEPLAGRLAMSTDGFVVRPRFFPGGDIGRLAVFGTANDLAMCGARPRFLTASFILEEGLPTEELQRIARSMGQAAGEAGMQLVAGDTKVVEKGKGDGVFISTAGLGQVIAAVAPLPAQVKPGDAILLSGDLGRHGVAILAAREELRLETTLESDCGCLAPPALALFEAGLEIHCLRDLTRGGLATALHEIARTAGIGLRLEESAIPLAPEVEGACEILGLDPLVLANEGRFVCFLPETQVERALAVLRGFSISGGARRVGTCSGEPCDPVRLVTLRTTFGTERLIDFPSGDLLPRIC